MSQWQPNTQELQQVLLLLEHSQSLDTTVQRNVQERLQQLAAHDSFCCYLVYIFSELKNQPESYRALAGLILKNNVRCQWGRYSADVQELVRRHVLTCIADQSPLIRATVGIIVTTIVMEEGVTGWPTLLPTLLEMLVQQEDNNMREGALGAIQKIFEDSGDRLDTNQHVTPIIKRLLPFFSAPSEKLRGLSMSSVNSILMLNNEPIDPVLDEFIQQLFSRAHDESLEVQKQLCRSLTLLLESHLEKLIPSISAVIEYILDKTQSTDEFVALEACEFWLALAEDTETCKQVVAPYVGQIIPVLIKRMRYSETDIILLKGNMDEADAMVPDRVQDIKPRSHKLNRLVGGMAEDEDDDDDDDFNTDWNIRRCSAATLDVFASIFKTDLLVILLPIIKEAVTHPEWEVKESGILALGAIAEGCMEGMTPYLQELVPFLMNMLQDSKPLVRSITYWTLSRYCNWVVDNPNKQFFEPLLKQLLSGILDGNKRVQEAACSAFATFEEEGGTLVVPYLDDILTTLVKAFHLFQAKNLLILYDALGTLAHTVGNALAQQKYAHLVMPPLMEKWGRLQNDDKELFQLLECVSAIASSMGNEFLPFSEVVFQRCATLVEIGALASAEANRNSNLDPPEKDFLIVALDLLSTLAETLMLRIEPLVSQSHIVQMLTICCVDVTADVRQSAFALLGDLVKCCWQNVKPHVALFLPMIQTNLDVSHVSVCNNAIWAFGEMALKMEGDMQPFVGQILLPLIEVLKQHQLQRTLLENTAISLGRLGIYCAMDVAPHLNKFIRLACISLRNVRDNPEKESAFRGLCYMINLNPMGVADDLVFWCDAIASWQSPPADLKQMFITIVGSFRAHVGVDDWNVFFGHFPPPLRERLHQIYGL